MDLRFIAALPTAGLDPQTEPEEIDVRDRSGSVPPASNHLSRRFRDVPATIIHINYWLPTGQFAVGDVPKSPVGRRLAFRHIPQRAPAAPDAAFGVAGRLPTAPAPIGDVATHKRNIPFSLTHMKDHQPSRPAEESQMPCPEPTPQPKK